MPNRSAQVSVVVVNYNGGLQILCCLDSLASYAKDAEIVVVDNHSTDGSVQKIKASYPHVRLFETGSNLGFGGGVNYGVSKATKEYIFILNPDTVVKPDTIDKLVNDYEKLGREVILGTKHLFPDGTPQNAGRSYPSHINALFNKTSLLTKLFPNNKYSKKYLSPDETNNPLKKVDWVSGATMFMRRATFEKLNGFDEDYFLYCEDVDLCKRAEKHGIDRIYDSDVEVMHAVGVSGKSAPFSVIKHRHESMWRYYRNHHERNIFLDFATLAGIGARASICIAEESAKKVATVPQGMKDSIREGLRNFLSKTRKHKKPLKGTINKVLFLRTDHLGDVLLSLPAIEKFKEKFPMAEIHLMGQPQWKELILATGLVKEYLSEEPSDLSRLKKFYSKKYDLLIELGQRETLRNAMLSWLARIPNRVGYHTSYTGLFYTKSLRWDYRFRPEIEMTGRLLHEVGIEEMPSVINLKEKLNLDVSLPVKLPDDYVVIHPFAVSSFKLKEWPYERFVELANELHSKGKTVVLVGTEKEANDFAEAVKKLDPGVLNLIGKTSILQLTRILSESRLLIANNSGVYQLAMALGKPCVMINGPSNLKRWGPVRSNVSVVQVKGLACAGRDCGQCIRGDHACMQEISVDQVLQASKKHL